MSFSLYINCALCDKQGEFSQSKPHVHSLLKKIKMPEVPTQDQCCILIAQAMAKEKENPNQHTKVIETIAMCQKFHSKVGSEKDWYEMTSKMMATQSAEAKVAIECQKRTNGETNLATVYKFGGGTLFGMLLYNAIAAIFFRR